jgi:ATP-dependent helicase/nuclease subunit A
LSSRGEFVPFVDRRARELASDPTLNIALEASAGTGKTRVLVERYVRLIEEGSAPRHILAITFTRKAAGEMKTRILEEVRGRPELWSEIRKRLFEIHVTTIDAFCLGLLREFPLEADLDPDVSLIDGLESARLQEEAIDQTLSAARARRGADVRFLIARFGEGALRRGIRDFLAARLVKEEVLARFVERVVPPGVSLERSLERLQKALSAAFRGPEGVERFLQTGPDSEPSAFRALAFALRRAVDPEKISAGDVEELRGYFLTGENEPRRRLSAAAAPERFSSREAYERHRDRALALAPQVALAYRHWLREKDFYAVRQIEALYREASRRFTELKRARSGLDFVDVLVQAVSLLEKRGEFSRSRFRLESRYHHLLIDEFQDTNDFQWRLIRALVDSWGEGSGLVQDAILDEQSRGPGAGRIREPSLFLVGDRKQSIYGWRDARVEVMESASRHLLRIRKEGRRLSLRHSFRASGELLSFLNDLFAEMPKVRGDLAWSFQYREADHFPLSSLDAAASPVALAAGKDPSSAAALVADEVVRLLQEEGLRPRDVAILFRSRSSYRGYEEALLSRGVPAYVYRGLGFFDSPEVMDVQALVRFLAEPQSELRAAELARSRFVAISDPGLWRIAAARRATAERTLSRWLAAGAVDPGLPLTPSDRAKAERARRLMPQLLSLVDRIPPGDLLEQALGESDYARFFASDRQSRENLKKVMEMVRRAQNRGYLTMSRLADLLAGASTDEESPAVLEAVDAVNLMTIHASKGLEFDSVFLVNMHQKRREDTSLPRIRELADGRVEVSALVPPALPAEPSGDEVSRVLEEEKRLLYVALTRARRNLTLSAVVGGASRGTLLELLPRGLQESIQLALQCAEPTVDWRSHRLRVLRARQAASGGIFRAENRERKKRLRLEPLGPDALSVLDEEGGDDGARRGDGNLESLSALFRSGEVYRDVCFSLTRGARVMRGSFDRLVVAGKRVTVVLFPDPPYQNEHRLRMETCLEAAEVLFPGCEVSGFLAYPEGAPVPVRRGESGGGSDRQLSLF